MPRSIPRPKDPEAVALAAIALRSYGSAEEPRSPLERVIHQVLASQGVRPEVAAAMSERFYRIRPTTRRQFFGELGELGAKVPSLRNLARDPNRVKTRPGVALPTGLVLAGARVLDPARFNDVVFDPDFASMRPTYTIRYKGIYCDDNTDDRWVTSDEIYVVTSAVHIRRADGENVIRTEGHPKKAGDPWYGDVDTFEWRVGPVAAAWFGDSDVVSLTAVVFEHDEGDPDAYKEEINTAVIVALGIASILWPGLAPYFALAGAAALLTGFFNSLAGSADDLVGEQTLVLEKNTLEALSASDLIRHVDSAHIFGETIQIRTDLRYHFFTEHSADGRYIVGFDVLRDPELPQLPPTPVE